MRIYKHSKPTEQWIIDLRAKWATGQYTLEQLAQEYEISASYARMLVVGVKRPHQKRKSIGRKLTIDDARAMREKYKNTLATTSTLAREYGVTRQLVGEILQNNVWRDPDYVYEKPDAKKRLAKVIARVRADKGEDECWDNDSVYTRMYGYKIYRRLTGDKRSGAYIHTCGNNACWNPKHITIDDRLAKNSSIFTSQQVQEMTDLWLTGKYTFIELGKRYEAHYNVVAGIIRRYLKRKGLDIVLPTREKQHARDREVMARLAQGEKLTDIARAMGIKYRNAVRIKSKYTKGQEEQ